MFLYSYNFLAVAGQTELIDQSRKAAEEMAENWNENWVTIITPDGGLYAALAKLGTTFAVCCFFFWGIKIVQDFVESGSTAFLHELIWPMIVVFFLAGNGAQLASLTIGMRGLLHRTNQQLLVQVSNKFSLDEAFQQAKNNVAARSEIGTLLEQCQAVTGQKQISCLESVRGDTEKIIANHNLEGNIWTDLTTRIGDAIEQAKNTSGNDILQGVVSNFSAPIGALIGAANQSIMRLVLVGTQIAFQQAFEISLLMTALLGPIAMGCSLLPVAAKPFVAWLTALFSIGIAKLSLNIMTGVGATLVANAEAGDHFWFLVYSAFMAPVLALSLAAGGGMATWSAVVAGQEQATGLAADTAMAVATKGRSLAKT